MHRPDKDTRERPKKRCRGIIYRHPYYTQGRPISCPGRVPHTDADCTTRLNCGCPRPTMEIDKENNNDSAAAGTSAASQEEGRPHGATPDRWDDVVRLYTFMPDIYLFTFLIIFFIFSICLIWMTFAHSVFSTFMGDGPTEWTCSMKNCGSTGISFSKCTT